MLNYYKTIDNRIMSIDQPTEGCWISAIAPTEAEISSLITSFGIEPDFLRAALDEEESSRVESEDGKTLVIVDIPTVSKQESNTVVYSTMPMGIIITEHNIITVCLRENPIISEFSDNIIKNLQTNHKARFLLMLLLRIAARFLQYLKQIDKISNAMERQINKMRRNKELVQLLELEKSLVYFSTSLKANEVTLERIQRGRVIKLYEEDQDLLDDVIIEFKQAMEMASIYSQVLDSTMSAFGSIISNNMNSAMKVLTSITIILAIPTLISGLYGMNVDAIPLPNFWIVAALSFAITGIVGIILWKKGMF